MSELHSVAARMVAKGKGVLAADESTGTCSKRFESIGVESTPETRCNYRSTLFTSPVLVESYYMMKPLDKKFLDQIISFLNICSQKIYCLELKLILERTL